MMRWRIWKIMEASCRNMKAILSFCLLMMLSFSGGTVRAEATANSGTDSQFPASNQLPAAYRNVGVDEHLNLQLPMDLQFYDENSQIIHLGDVFHPGRPVLLQLGYLDCPMLCDAISRTLVDAAKKIDPKIGKDFDFVFISIDPSDSPDIARQKKNNYVAEYNKDGSAAGFHFLVGKQKQIDEITTAIGYRYQ